MKFEKVIRVGMLSGVVAAEVTEHGDVVIKWNGCAKGTNPEDLSTDLQKAEVEVVARLSQAWQKFMLAEYTLRNMGYEEAA